MVSVRPTTQSVVRKMNEVEQAIRTLIQHAGDDPDREGMTDTPKRVARAYKEWFSGYDIDPKQLLERTFEECGGFDEMVVVDGIRFESHCEHHMVPIVGTATVGYIPGQRIVGISKLARVVDAYAKRFIVQERMTRQVADVVNEVLEPQGVGVVVSAEHLCMTTRGVYKPGSATITSSLLGVFRDDAKVRSEFLALARDASRR